MNSCGWPNGNNHERRLSVRFIFRSVACRATRAPHLDRRVAPCCALGHDSGADFGYWPWPGIKGEPRMATTTPTEDGGGSLRRRRLTRAADYILGRNTLIGVASLMLLVISGFATWHGMRDFIIGVSHADQPGPEPAGRHVGLQRRAGDRGRRRAHLPDVADAARDLRRPPASARAARHLPALRVPGDLVDRLRLRLLVEPDLGRGGDPHRPRRPAGGRARRQRRDRRPARRGARASSTAWSPGRRARWRARRRAAAAAACRPAPARARSTTRAAACAIPSSRCATA